MQTVITLLRKVNFYPSNFQQISSLEPNLTMKFKKFGGENFNIKSATNNLSKTLSYIKINPRQFAYFNTFEIFFITDFQFIIGNMTIIWRKNTYKKFHFLEEYKIIDYRR
jgi:hypothetical protein